MSLLRRPIEGVRSLQATTNLLRGRVEHTLVWRIWERLLETEFVDRSIALAAKAFVSFFPLVIVIAAFMPDDIRRSIFTTVTSRLGLGGHALSTAKEAFASSKDVRRATGLLGLVFTIFYASSFTTAMQRVYLRAWRRPRSSTAVNYVRGPAWLGAILVYFALLGATRSALSGPPGTAAFLIVSLAGAFVLWWLTASLMLRGQVRPRALVASGVLTGFAMSVYAAASNLWMPGVVESHQQQFGFFGVALALVTWFSGAALCIVIGACAGSVLAEDTGVVGRWVRGVAESPLVPGAAPALPSPTRVLRLVDALGMRSDDDDVNEGPP